MIYHQGLSAGRWRELTFAEQMANTGSEVERALNWKAKNQPAYFQKAADRALELMDLTLEGATTFPRRRELARARETLADYFFGENQFAATDQAWRRYFSPFSFVARRNR